MQTAFDSIKDAEEFITQAVIVRGGNHHDVYRKVQSWHACGYSCVVWVLGNPVQVVLSARAFPVASVI